MGVSVHLGIHVGVEFNSWHGRYVVGVTLAWLQCDSPVPHLHRGVLHESVDAPNLLDYAREHLPGLVR